MKNWIIVLLTLAVVVVGAFLPDLLLRDVQPDINMDYQEVTITSETTSDYAWRMERLAEHSFGEGVHLLTTYISDAAEDSDAGDQFLTELDRLVTAGVLSEQLRELMDESEGSVHYYYLFDNEAVSGFRYAEFTAGSDNWKLSMIMDVESGKLARVDYQGSQKMPQDLSFPEGFSSWYDLLRSYADYLGLSTAALASTDPIETTPEGSARQYYEERTADKLAACVGSGSAWLELRVLREAYQTSIAVYTGGK